MYGNGRQLRTRDKPLSSGVCTNYKELRNMEARHKKSMQCKSNYSGGCLQINFSYSLISLVFK